MLGRLGTGPSWMLPVVRMSFVGTTARTTKTTIRVQRFSGVPEKGGGQQAGKTGPRWNRAQTFFKFICK